MLIQTIGATRGILQKYVPAQSPESIAGKHDDSYSTRQDYSEGLAAERERAFTGVTPEKSPSSAIPDILVEKARGVAQRVFNANRQFTLLSENLKEGIISFYSHHPDRDSSGLTVIGSLDTLIGDCRLNQDVLQQLELMAAPAFRLTDSINREDLIKQALADIAYPETIMQGDKNTCAATSIQIALAIKKPARYLQIVKALAGSDGDASSVVAGLKRDSGTPVQDDASGRSLTTRLLNPAFMEYGSFGDYHDAEDMQTVGPFRLFSGLNQLEKKRLYEGVMAEKATNYGSGLNRLIGFLQRRTFNSVRRALEKGKTVLASINVQDTDGSLRGGHAVVIQRIDDCYAYLLNPWGRKQKIPVEELKDMLTLATISEGTESAPLPSSLQNPDNYLLTHIEFKNR